MDDAKRRLLSALHPVKSEAKPENVKRRAYFREYRRRKRAGKKGKA